MEDIEKRVRKIIIDQLGVTEDEVKPESLIKDDLGADSLDEVELLMYSEDEFDIEIDDVQSEKIKTVQEMINHITEAIK